MTSNNYYVCNDCGEQFPPNHLHNCERAARRQTAEGLDRLITGDVESALGLLWLYRVAYRVRRTLNGLERYGDRAAMARRVCGLLGDE